VNRIANCAPSTGTTITTEGQPITAVGTVAHPTLAAATPCRKHAPSAADLRRRRGSGRRPAFRRLCLLARQRGGLGRLDLRDADFAHDAPGNRQGLFGPRGATAVLAATPSLAAAIRCIGIGFQRGNRPLAAGREQGLPGSDLGGHDCDLRQSPQVACWPLHRGPAERQSPSAARRR
jgi:hypothetical protein